MRRRQLVSALGQAAVLLLTAAAAGAGQAGCRQLAGQLERRPTAEEWREVESGGVLSWQTEVEGSPVKKGLAVGLVKAPPERVFDVVTDNARFAEFMPHVKESTVEPQADGSVINYQRLGVPGRDREYKIRIVNRADPAAAVPLWESRWTHVKGFGNIEESEGAWRVFACGEFALVEYRVLTDPGGWLPTGLKNWATRKSLRRLITAVRERLKVLGENHGE